MALGAFIRQVRVLERHVPHRYAKIHTPDRPHMKNIVVKGLLILLAVAARQRVSWVMRTLIVAGIATNAFGIMWWYHWAL